MSWEQRLRDLILAGGTFVAAGCGKTQSQSAVDASAPALDAWVPSGECCNANPDPCCEVDSCGAPMTPACACERDGGTWNSALSDGGEGCGFPAPACLCGGSNDPCCAVNSCGAPMTAECACEEEGGTWRPDLGADGGPGCEPTFVAPCCNANPDPCCPVLNCGAPMNAECACRLDGGSWTSEQSCSFADGGGDADGPK
jgi:hypothetical protein